MFRLHCNKCYLQSTNEPMLPFSMTRCRHIICVKCLETSKKDQNKCPLCNAPLQTIRIDRNMPKGMAQYFENPLRHLENYKKVMKFQCEQRTSDNVGFWHLMQQESEMELKLEGYNKLEARLSQQLKVEKQRIAEMQRYLAYHEEAAPSSSSQCSSVRERLGSRSSQMRSHHHRRPRPRTPSVTTTTENSISDE
ncbi:hypothetical protein KR054_011735, partial [Drosophila jambulina]